MSYQNLIEITKLLEQFEQQNEGSTFNISDFSYWLLDEVAEKPHSLETNSTEISHSIQKQSPNVQISILIGRMSKYARVYTKKILSKTPLSGLDDYSFMATLMFRKSLTKSELTHHNIMDSNTSGSDIIKRLEKHELVEEFDDAADKRTKRVQITNLGKQLMFKIFEEMDTVSEIITGNLENSEKLNLLSYLKKLDHLHKNIYDRDRKMPLIDIKQKYIAD